MLKNIKSFIIKHLGVIYTILFISSVMGTVGYFNKISHRLTVEQSYRNGYMIAKDLLYAKEHIETPFDMTVDHNTLVLAAKSTIAKSTVTVEKGEAIQSVFITGASTEVQELLDISYLSQLYAYPEAFERLSVELESLETKSWQIKSNNSLLVFDLITQNEQVELIIKITF